MSFEIKFDYRFDESNFFTPERKAILEQAGSIWSSYIQDDFAAIPAQETLKFSINNINREVVLSEPIDDLLIFISSVELGENSSQPTLGEGAFHATFEVGSDRETRIIRNDFEPWLGTIEFNANFADRFYFDSTPETDDDIPANKQDFLSLSLHEIGHILGIGISPAFNDLVKDGSFTGAKSVKLNNNRPVPLDSDRDHIRENFSVNFDSDALLDKSFTFGERNLPTDLDLAILADIGYDIPKLERTDNKTPVYRFFQYEKGFHFYTTDTNEGRYVVERSEVGELHYKYENIAYNVLSSNEDALTGAKIAGALPVYRFFNQITGAHLYTIEEKEKNFVQKNLPNYAFEGEAYYAFESEPEIMETVPLYRMLNTQSGAHLFTSDRKEFNFIQANEPQFQIEANDGIAFYVLE